MIYVCIPSHNEAPTVGPLLWKASRVLRDFGREFHLVVLDDGSTDETREVLARYEKVLPLTVLSGEGERGYGTAVDRLLRHTVEVSDYPKRDAAVVLQADLTDDPERLVDLVKTLEGGADIVAGAGAVPPADLPPRIRWARRLVPWVLGPAFRSAPVEDPLCGLRAYRVIVLKKAVRDLSGPLASAPEPWVANLELLQRVVGFARRVEDLPVVPRYGLMVRDSRFRPVHTLRRLLPFRSSGWTPEATPAAGKQEVAA